jgi:hypothetical protein
VPGFSLEKNGTHTGVRSAEAERYGETSPAPPVRWYPFGKKAPENIQVIVFICPLGGSICGQMKTENRVFKIKNRIFKTTCPQTASISTERKTGNRVFKTVCPLTEPIIPEIKKITGMFSASLSPEKNDSYTSINEYAM